MQFQKYESRLQAGGILAEFINDKDQQIYKQILKNQKEFVCFAISNSGISVTEGYCSRFNLNYDILIVRKIGNLHICIISKRN